MVLVQIVLPIIGIAIFIVLQQPLPRKPFVPEVLSYFNGCASCVSFMPTQYCPAGILHNLTVWMTVRQARVREWLNASSSRH